MTGEEEEAVTKRGGAVWGWAGPRGLPVCLTPPECSGRQGGPGKEWQLRPSIIPLSCSLRPPFPGAARTHFLLRSRPLRPSRAESQAGDVAAEGRGEPPRAAGRVHLFSRSELQIVPFLSA